MPDKKEVTISTSALNSYGFRVITSGINIEQYKKNPILLWGHHRTWRGTTDEVLPIGIIEDLRIDGDKLIGTPKFDQEDEFAKRIQSKWDAGILKMVSAGIDIIELSDSPEFLLPGQRRMSVTKSKLLEVSIVDIGANDEAITLYKQGKSINLSNNDECEIGVINNQNTKTEKMKEIALKLGMYENASNDEILLKIDSVLSQANKVADLEKKIENLQKESLEQEVDNAIALKKINQGQKEHFTELGQKVGIEMLRETLSHMRPMEKPSEVISQFSSEDGKRVEKLSDLTEENKAKLRKEDRKEYARLYKAEYGVEPDLN